MDIIDADDVNRVFAAVQPAAAMLLAAMADIDLCEAEPEQAFAVNVRGAENVAKACAKQGARLLFASTAAVFDGRKKGYSEDDQVSPLSVYGMTKVRAEEVVQKILPSATIVRVSLVLGFAMRPSANSLVNTLIKSWRAGKAVQAPTFEHRNPLHADSLSRVMIALIENSAVGGIYHAGASDCLSRYELAKRLANRAGFPPQLVHPQHSPKPGRAPRGAHHFLLTEKLQQLRVTCAQSCDEAIERCFA
jgi:dTDP-4-dehydrorhamnose reductase